MSHTFILLASCQGNFGKPKKTKVYRSSRKKLLNRGAGYEVAYNVQELRNIANVDPKNTDNITIKPNNHLILKFCFYCHILLFCWLLAKGILESQKKQRSTGPARKKLLNRGAGYEVAYNVQELRNIANVDPKNTDNITIKPNNHLILKFCFYCHILLFCWLLAPPPPPPLPSRRAWFRKF